MKLSGFLVVALVAAAGCAMPPIPSDGAPLALPRDRTQYLAKIRGRFVAVPMASVAVPPPTAIKLVSGVDALDHIPRYVRVRESYGGAYPFVVVNSRESFALVSRDGDVLALGVPHPKRVIVPQDPIFILSPQPDGSVMASAAHDPSGNIDYVEGRLDASVQLPPAVPEDVLQRLDLYDFPGSTREPYWDVNRRRAYEVSELSRYRNLRDPDGRAMRVFQVNLE